jgi:hypothetical protein
LWSATLLMICCFATDLQLCLWSVVLQLVFTELTL